MAKNMSNEQYLSAIKGCKQSRSVGLCERKCAHWRPMFKNSPAFCRSASCSSKNAGKKHVNNCYNSRS